MVDSDKTDKIKLEELKMQRIIDRWFELLVIGIFTYGANTLSNMSTDIAGLNKSIAVIVEKVVSQEKITGDHEQRIRKLETQ